jgi:hypothetical protein
MDTVLQQKYFHSNGNFYKPNKGIAMGGPLSRTATELILQYYEETTLKHWLETDEIQHYRGYVDDILIIYDKTKINSNNILQLVNHYNRDLNFTLTNEENNSISYLDLLIYRTSHNLQLGIH